MLPGTPLHCTQVWVAAQFWKRWPQEHSADAHCVSQCPSAAWLDRLCAKPALDDAQYLSCFAARKFTKQSHRPAEFFTTNQVFSADVHVYGGARVCCDLVQRGLDRKYPWTLKRPLRALSTCQPRRLSKALQRPLKGQDLSGFCTSPFPSS